jgi:hypothetical protein
MHQNGDPAKSVPANHSMPRGGQGNNPIWFSFKNFRNTSKLV